MDDDEILTLAHEIVRDMLSEAGYRDPEEVLADPNAPPELRAFFERLAAVELPDDWQPGDPWPRDPDPEPRLH